MQDNSTNGEVLTLLDISAALWTQRWLIAVTTVGTTLIAAVFLFFATEWYQAEVLLGPADERATPAISGQLGGLAALAGVSIGGAESAEAVAVLGSRQFARSFIEDEGVLTTLLYKYWDPEAQQWQRIRAGRYPDIRDAVDIFHEEVLSVRKDRDTGQVRLIVEWLDPATAADWANVLASRINVRMRERALQEATTNVSFLREELSGTTVVTLQQAIGRLLETELQKLMLARGAEEFAFRVLDPAEIPTKRVRPKRFLIVMMSGAVGLFGSSLLAIVLYTFLGKGRT